MTNRPSFARVGVHLDLRVQVPPFDALCRIADDAARNGANTLIVEWEATFPFDRHAIISNQYAYTEREIAAFIRHCDHLGIDVVPLQQCFGHVEYILQHARYAHLRENSADLCQLCPCRADEAMAVFREIFQEVAAAHPSEYFHLGGDETYLLGNCPTCRAYAKEHGDSQLYVGYMKRLAEEVIALGKRPLIWIDMLLKHQEAACDMPQECVFVDWNYGWPVDRFGDFSRLATLPFEFWGAAAMRSAPDNHSSFSWRTHLENLRDYIPIARQMNFQGMFLTSWSTSGLYGYEWEIPGRVQKIWPVRRTTLHAALPILTAAFGEAVQQEEPLDIEGFVIRYGCDHFGFSPKDAQFFLDALLLSDLPDKQGLDLGVVLQNLLRSKDILDRLMPKDHQREFLRYTLMVDLAVQQLRVLLLDRKAQSADLDRQGRQSLVRHAENLLTQSDELDRRYVEVFAGELYMEELQEEMDFRSKALRQLHARLTGRRDVSVSAEHTDILPFPAEKALSAV